MNDTFWDYQNKVERCTYCDKIIIDSFHYCDNETNIADEESYSDRLDYAFKLLRMDE